MLIRAYDAGLAIGAGIRIDASVHFLAIAEGVGQPHGETARVAVGAHSRCIIGSVDIGDLGARLAAESLVIAETEIEVTLAVGKTEAVLVSGLETLHAAVVHPLFLTHERERDVAVAEGIGTGSSHAKPAAMSGIRAGDSLVAPVRAETERQGIVEKIELAVKLKIEIVGSGAVGIGADQTAHILGSSNERVIEFIVVPAVAHRRN